MQVELQKCIIEIIDKYLNEHSKLESGEKKEYLIYKMANEIKEIINDENKKGESQWKEGRVWSGTRKEPSGGTQPRKRV